MPPAPDNFAPIPMECDAPHLPVLGALPRGLAGTLYRNGPNPQFPPAAPGAQHWFLGDGMLHAFTLEDGRARYRNRWIRTDKFVAEQQAGRALGGPLRRRTPDGGNIADTGVANTNIVWHAGRLLALEEAHLPIEIEPDSLATRGVQTFGGLRGPFTAHPKPDPATGELVFFGYSAAGPLSAGMHWGTIDAAGAVTRLERFDAPFCAMVHDFAVTAVHVLFPVMPLTGSLQRAMTGGLPFAWEPELGGHVGLLRRDRGVASLRWFRAESCYAFHVLNAWDEDGRVCADVMQYDAPPLFPRADGTRPDPASTVAKLVRWTLDPDAGTDAFRRTTLDDMSAEFPRIDDRVAGRANRYGAFAADSGAGVLDTIAWRDMQDGSRRGYTLPAGDATSEPVFVPRSPAAPEGDGWLLAVVWRAAERRSDMIVLDTADVAAGPVATVQLGHRVPFGFHGNWVGAQ